MKTGTYSIEITAQLILNKRELELLHHIASYNHEQVAESVQSSAYIGGCSKAEVIQFFSELRSQTGLLKDRIEANKPEIFTKTI